MLYLEIFKKDYAILLSSMVSITTPSFAEIIVFSLLIDVVSPMICFLQAAIPLA